MAFYLSPSSFGRHYRRCQLADKKYNVALSKLPVELQVKIIGCLRYESVLALRRTSRHFHSLVPISDLAGHYAADKFFLVIDETNKRRNLGLHYCRSIGGGPLCWCKPQCREFDSYNGPLPCYTCLAWLPRSSFSFHMTHGLRALGQPKSQRRICLPCGMRNGFYPGGTSIGASVVCVGCAKLYDGYFLYLKPDRRFKAKLCRECAPIDRHEHVHSWETRCKDKAMKRYLEGMRKGKEYRSQKGEQLRRERGIVIEEEKLQSIDTADQSDAIDAPNSPSSSLSEKYRPFREPAPGIHGVSYHSNSTSDMNFPNTPDTFQRNVELCC